VRLPRPAALAALAAALLLATAGCGGGGDGGGDASTATTVAPVATTPTTKGPPTVLAIVSPAAGTEIKGNVVTLDVTSSGITITAADGDTSGHTGHYHVFVDREPVEPGEVIPVAADIIHTTADPIVITGLHVGPHRLTVIYGDGTHRRIGVTEAATSFTVLGPSVDATAPPNVAAGQPVVISVKVEGLTIPGDAILYAVPDPESGLSGDQLGEGVIQSTGTTIAVPDLAPGTHVIWVGAATPDRVPLQPPVIDKVTVTIG